MVEQMAPTGREAEALLNLLPGVAVRMVSHAGQAALQPGTALEAVGPAVARLVNPAALANLRARLHGYLGTEAALARTADRIGRHQRLDPAPHHITDHQSDRHIRSTAQPTNRDTL
ncbi:hypothetical protein [Streptomyces sp. BE303]|uniref:hypothetical protein n=1 Tax=Streptomyces sp. BE303 TaxID=3002528 RepID=UPI002E78DEAD|nr:hypothetical protein [Streptomyces sp. BE303]MED7947395.1 hypothetical protein [Streptomyces sp. BE303]